MSEGTLTLRELFADDVRDLSARVEPGLDARQATQKAEQEIKKASRAIQSSWVRKAVAEKAQDLLDLNLVDSLVGAWKKYTEIAQYANPGKYRPGEKILVPVAERTVKSVLHPYVQILLQDREVDRVVFDLEFSLTLQGLVLGIQDGKIKEINAGSGKGEASLSLKGAELWKRALKPVRFPGYISLGDGIPLRG